ncbi:MAG: MTH938/NDUFAF3 family protein [Euryarchaeota archaeon]|nr:MTH938/NDUFAF3 family protein [Euryarchaeota archaeon]
MMINSYDFGRIVVDGKAYTSDVIIFPNRVKDNWWRKEGHALHIEDIELVVEEKQDVLIVGTGNYGLLEVLPETKKYIESKGIELIVKPTDKACEMYNKISKNKKAVAALHLTC